jgi:hypothetical protein
MPTSLRKSSTNAIVGIGIRASAARSRTDSWTMPDCNMIDGLVTIGGGEAAGSARL